MWARVKGRTELEIIKIFPNGYGFRPGFIQPLYGVMPRTRALKALYALAAPIAPALVRWAPRYATTSERLGKAMLRAARIGFPVHIVENKDLG